MGCELYAPLSFWQALFAKFFLPPIREMKHLNPTDPPARRCALYASSFVCKPLISKIFYKPGKRLTSTRSPLFLVERGAHYTQPFSFGNLFLQSFLGHPLQHLKPHPHNLPWGPPSTKEPRIIRTQTHLTTPAQHYFLRTATTEQINNTYSTLRTLYNKQRRLAPPLFVVEGGGLEQSILRPYLLLIRFTELTAPESSKDILAPPNPARWRRQSISNRHKQQHFGRVTGHHDKN